MYLSVLALVLLSPVWADNFYQDATVTFGDQRAQIQDGGRLLALSLDKISGSGFQSKNEYLFGRFDMQLKLVPRNSAGTVTTFYLSSQGAGHDEIDFEFLGNSSGQPYTVHTNVYSQGKGNKEQQFRLWFDPTSSFHTYSIVWNSQRIIFLVDNIPIRVFNNHEALGVAFPKNQAMRVYASLWNADDWATQGGRVKTDWSMAPFTASYRNFNTNACVWSAATSTSSCGGSKTDSVNNDQTWQSQQLNANGRNRLRWVQQKYMIYNYCADANRFSQGFSPECKRSRGKKNILSLLALVLLSPVWADNFYQDATVTFGDQRAQIQDGGRLLALSLDKISGSGFQSKNEYLFGRFDMQLKLVPGNSAGTVTTFYLSSQGAGHDEIDFEFLGNSSGQPYTVHTNVYSQGKGNKEQQFRLWFDPTSSFHTYSIVWNSQRIIFLVDNIPIRVFNNHEALGVAFPKNQAMRVYASLWNADDWATQGGRVKTDWSMAPFTASYRNFNTNGCAWSAATSTSSCEGSKTDSVNNDQTWQTQQLNANGRNRLRWVQQKYMIYNYCADANRFSQGFSPECKRSRF
ncbi:hypothetical protein H5410_038627 [Solanum commersonii]|uniref:xyloglucan:xyloglucosyl transferase n=1 Tax=Solanum commersonii TaxID=4109 RepID=A0A9J5Y9I2_SOLCO|nr:hypothetical protein H5410_038627 [Solanum commersonii]